MKPHTIKKLPVPGVKGYELKYKLVTNRSMLNSTVEVFKIKGGVIIGVDYYNNSTSVRLINKEIGQDIIYIKKVQSDAGKEVKVKQSGLSLF